MHAVTSSMPKPVNAAELIQRAREGRADALSELYARFGQTLMALAFRLTGSRADAEDVLHDVFVGLPEALSRYEERGSLAAWLRRITARAALMRLRRGRRRREVALAGAFDKAAPASATLDDLALHTAIHALPD